MLFRTSAWNIYTGVPHALLEFSPTPITHAVMAVYSIKVHAPVLGLTVRTVLVPCSGFDPRHCGVSLKSSTIVLNTFSVASHTTGLFKVRDCAVDVAVTASIISRAKKFFIWYLSTSPIFFCAGKFCPCRTHSLNNTLCGQLGILLHP